MRSTPLRGSVERGARDRRGRRGQRDRLGAGGRGQRDDEIERQHDAARRATAARAAAVLRRARPAGHRARASRTIRPAGIGTRAQPSRSTSTVSSARPVDRLAVDAQVVVDPRQRRVDRRRAGGGGAGERSIAQRAVFVDRQHHPAVRRGWLARAAARSPTQDTIRQARRSRLGLAWTPPGLVDRRLSSKTPPGAGRPAERSLPLSAVRPNNRMDHDHNFVRVGLASCIRDVGIAPLTSQRLKRSSIST